MAITLRSKREIESLRRAGKIVAEVLLKLQEAAEPGVSTAQLDDLASSITADAGAKALFRGVKSPYAKKPFPGAICASINEQVVHGIPSKKVKLQDGDILSVDFGVKLAGYCGDAAITIGIGEVSPEKQRLMDVTRQVLDVAIAKSAPGLKWSEIAAQMEECASQSGFSVVRDFVGHGIGTEMHEDPKVPNFVSKELLRNDILLKEGMILAVEPMVNIGSHVVRTLRDGWTVVTRDGKCSAHFEHSLAIVNGGCEVLTA
ncbi:MAG: type I methionyl aminopeptidase [Planctomycetes bacterium]|nr:type I methionyl aminopeptidase [Planctomycetota bacterium]